LTAIPAARSSAPVLKIRFYTIFGSLLLAAVAGIFAAVSWATYQPQAVDLTAPVPRGRGLATVTADAYLRGALAPVPVVQGLTYKPAAPGAFQVDGEVRWDRFSRFALPSGTFERHTLLFYRVMGTENSRPLLELSEITVLVAVPSTPAAGGIAQGTPALAATPSVRPAKFRNSAAIADFSDLEGVAPLPPTSRDLLTTQWVKAYATDNAELLLRYSGTSDTGFRYIGIGGFTDESTLRVVTAVNRGDDAWLVRARVLLAGANGTQAEMDLDVTIRDASSGNPKIVAWGPAGSGALTPDAARIPVDR
jgi:hypothetical protein